ncbi:hypothetical protein RclHR1_05780007 [Rhizophagus clarus]|uniref:BTB domain-containing protein n=1 Tax=Rhizophagus clarus TaxID=94130 RepID=A0A2Z6RP70_9GLOM|nr:hypothetical protein RclHR1_05780007 [Rhizophagus clarus]GES73765.1 hypothetical protein GLOIN_2v1768267 [Rhizophagus clarus]
MTSLFYSNLSKDLSLILNNADDYNVIIEVGENENKKEFRAHSVILRARSPYFKGALSSCWITKKNDMIIFNKPNISPNIFKIILRYIYMGEIDLSEVSCKEILELLIASDELLIEELFNHVQDYITEQPTDWIQGSVPLAFRTAFKLTNCKKLQNYCIESICEDSYSFIVSNEFLSIDKEILYKLLERDDLQTNEIVAWDRLIEWGIEQTPGLEDENCDREKWSEEDFVALKETLNQFIPLIRFAEITPNEFHNKIRPYKEIIPKQIYEEIEDFYHKSILPKMTTLPPRIRKIDSKIIKPKLVRIIVNWINKEDLWATSHYKFNLIYRGSIDGISNETFKNKCKGQMKGLVLIKVKQSNKIFGGYSSIGFHSIGNNDTNYDLYSRYYYSSDNFIFSFENSEDTQNMKISQVINYDKAIYDYYGTGFDFGFNSLFMYKNQYLHVNNGDNNYENNLNTHEIYEIEEIETFVIH